MGGALLSATVVRNAVQHAYSEAMTAHSPKPLSSSAALWTRRPYAPGHMRGRIRPVKFPNRGQFERFLTELNDRGIPGPFVYSVREAPEPDPHAISSLDTFLETHTERDLENLVVSNFVEDGGSSRLTITIRFFARPVTEGHLKFFVTYHLMGPVEKVGPWVEREPSQLERLIEKYTVPQLRTSPIVTADTAIDFDRKRREARIRWASAGISFLVALGTAIAVEWICGG